MCGFSCRYCTFENDQVETSFGFLLHVLKNGDLKQGFLLCNGKLLPDALNLFFLLSNLIPIVISICEEVKSCIISES